MICIVLLGYAIVACLGVPPPVDRSIYSSVITQDDAEDVMSMRASFKYKYVLEGGTIVDSSSGAHIEVSATSAVHNDDHYKAALIISRMVRHMPHAIFSNLVHHNARVGVFAHSEKLSIFPEFHHLADKPECHNTCSGSCSSTCTFDGRKWDKTAGAGGIRAVCTIDNVVCNHFDPYRNHDNILLHEFGHTIMNYGMDHATKSKEMAAYTNAKQKSIWDLHSYAMVNNQEYWAEATGAFFNAEHQRGSNGHMNECGSSFCTSEHAARQNIQSHDPHLYEVLQYVYTNNNPSLPGNIGVCIH